MIAEILLFWVAAPVIARLRPLGLLLAAAAAGLLRWGILATTTDVVALAAVQWLHALTFGAAHLGAVHFIAERAAPSLQATAQSLYSALSGGLLMGGAMLAAGRLYEIEPAAAFMAMTGLSAAGGLIAGFLMLTGRKRRPG